MNKTNCMQSIEQISTWEVFSSIYPWGFKLFDISACAVITADPSFVTFHMGLANCESIHLSQREFLSLINWTCPFQFEGLLGGIFHFT